MNDSHLAIDDAISQIDTLKKTLRKSSSLQVRAVQERSIIKATALAPDFSSLITDPQMQQILRRRWLECIDCISAGAPLAATVMMGGLLEALLLARINHEKNKAAVFKASTAPKDKASGQTLPL